MNERENYVWEMANKSTTRCRKRDEAAAPVLSFNRFFHNFMPKRQKHMFSRTITKTEWDAYDPIFIASKKILNFISSPRFTLIFWFKRCSKNSSMPACGFSLHIFFSISHKFIGAYRFTFWKFIPLIHHHLLCLRNMKIGSCRKMGRSKKKHLFGRFMMRQTRWKLM